MDIVVQWATILSPIIAVGIAIWASRSSAKDTAKHIAAIEESTKKQIDSIKEFEKIQLELSYTQAVKELKEAYKHYRQISQRTIDENSRDNMFNHIGGEFEYFRQQENRKRDMSDSQDFYDNQIKELNEVISRIESLRKAIGGM